MTDTELLKNIQEHLKIWAKEEKLAVKLIINEIITYLLTKLK